MIYNRCKKDFDKEFKHPFMIKALQKGKATEKTST